MKYSLKCSLAIVLCFTMVFAVTGPAFANDIKQSSQAGLKIRKDEQSIQVSLNGPLLRATAKWMRLTNKIQLSFHDWNKGDWQMRDFEIEVISANDERILANLIDMQSKEKHLIDSSKVKASMFFMPALLIVGELLLVEMFMASAAIVIAGITYIAISEIANKLRKREPKHYAAYLDVKKGVYIGKAIDLKSAVSRLMETTFGANNVWSVSKFDASQVALFAGQHKKPILDAPHGPYPKYLPHFHRFDRKGGHSFF